ncbi:MAG: hypothetical protein GY867_00220, partial [bacterium]|nr:hypothetical protein [bacterium]
SSNPTAHGVVFNASATPEIYALSPHDGPPGATGAFTSSMTGLTTGTTYYVRAYATNEAGTSYGSQVSFTSDQLSTVTTQAVTSVGTSTATGNGNITDLGSSNPTAHGVVWNTSGTPTTSDSSTDEGATSATGVFTSSMTGLTPGTTYYVRAYATNEAGTSYGNQINFTADELATVTTQAMTSVGTSTATGNGNITDLGVPNPTAHGMVWNTSGTPTTSDSSA